MIFEYKGAKYPDYLQAGNMCQYIEPSARHFCKGPGLDVGASRWPISGQAKRIELTDGGDAMKLPEGKFPFVFSSHCLEHLVDPVAALKHWKTRIQDGGVLFLYLPHPEMAYWRPENCTKHLHIWTPAQMVDMVETLGFRDVIHSERDLCWSFAVVGFQGQ